MADEIRWALQNGDMDKVNELFAQGFKPNEELGGSGRRPLHIAADYGQRKVLEKLFENGAFVDQKDSNGITPLLATVWEGHVSCAEFLLEKGANPNGTAPDGTSYLQCAESPEMKELLKKYCSN